MEKQIQNLLNKYETKPLNSIKLEDNILDIEKNIILEKESQIPSFVLASNCPFDKNYCFNNINLTVSTKENIFPKEKYFLKSQQIIELKPLDVNTIFSDDKIFKNEKLSSNNDNNNIDDIDSVKKKIMTTIETHHYKNFIPSKKYLEQNEINNEWYIIGNNKNEGPFNDFLMYNKLYQIYNECILKKEKNPNYLINEKRSDTFMTMDDCFDRLRAKYEYRKQNINSQNNLMLQYMNNMMLYRNQMLQYYSMNKNMQKNNQINLENQNRINAPNKFDNYNNKNSIINNDNKNEKDEKKEKGYRNDNKYDNHNNNRWKYNKRNNNFNNNYHQNKFNKKEKRYKENEIKEIKDNDNNQNKDKKKDNNNENNNNTVEEKKEEEKIIKAVNVEEVFKKE